MMRFFRTSGQIRREAADWVARLAGGADAEDRAAFLRWKDEDPRHGQAYDRIAAIWSASGQVRPSAVKGIASKPAARFGAPGLVLVGSVLAAAILVSVLLLQPRWLRDSATRQALSVASATGEIRQVGLPDGSRLVLDSASRVEVDFSSGERRLQLVEGRARFFVAHDSRPFVVRAASSEVVATGTVFDVGLIRGRLSILLLEGSVDVRPVDEGRGAARQRLAAGQKLVIGPREPAVPQPIARGDPAWTRRMLEFDETPLEEAAALVNRYTHIQLRLAGAGVGDLRVSGAYRAGDTAGFARSLAAAFDLSLETLPDGSLLLSRRQVPSR
jgi:transmembrane sensor